MLTGRVVLVTGGATGIGRDIAAGLSRMGAEVPVVDGPMESRSEAERAFSQAAGSARIDAVVHALVDPDALVPAPFDDIDEASWDRRCEAMLRMALWCSQAAYGVLNGWGGPLVFVTPTIGLTGAAGLAPYATAVEGIRSLAKSAARQWQSNSITVNCVAPSIEVIGADGQGGPVAEVVAMLVASGAHHVTGGTFVVDGGVVMAP